MKISILIEALTGSFETDVKRATKTAEKEAAAMRKAFVDNMKVIGAAIGTIGSTAATAAVAITNSVAKSAESLERLALVSNTGVVEFQRYAAAAKMVGVEQDKLADIFKDVQDKVGDFLQTGGGALADFFENIAPKVGVTAEQFRKLSGPDALQLYVSSLEKAGVAQSEMVFFLEAIASDATLLEPILRNNGEAAKEFGDQAQRAGAILSEESVGSLKQYQLAMREIGMIYDGVKNQIAIELAPTLTALAEIFIDSGTDAQTGARGIKALGDALQVLLVLGFGAVETIKTLTAVVAGMADVTVASAKLMNALRPTNLAMRALGQEAPSVADALNGFDAAVTNAANGIEGQYTDSVAQLTDAMEKLLNPTNAASDATERLQGVTREIAPTLGQAKKRTEELAKAAESLAKAQDAAADGTMALVAEMEGMQRQTDELIAGLEFELQLLGMTNDQREEAIALRQLGANATAEEAARVRELIGELQREAEIQAAAAAFQSIWLDAANSVGDALTAALFDGAESGADAIMDVMEQLARDLVRFWLQQNIVIPLQQQMMGGFGGGGGGGFNSSMMPWLAAAGGALYGFNNAGSGGASSLAAGAAYGGLAWTGATIASGAALGAAGATAGAGIGAAAGGATSGAMGAAAAVPVIGWVLSAMAVIDMVSGGRLFGTRFRAESSESTLALGPEGGSASVSLTEVRQRSLFRGRTWRDREIDPSDDAIAAAEGLFTAISDTMARAAMQLRGEAPAMIDAAIRTVVEYDSKGREKATKILVDILGRTWEEATAEAAATRISAEAIIATIDEIMGNEAAVEIANAIAGPVGRNLEDALGAIGEGLGGTTSQIMGEASAIAERWRDNAETLMQGAQFLLSVATDIRNGFDLLGTGTLTPIVDLIEEMTRGGETLQQTYTRLALSTMVLDEALGFMGVELELGREAFVRFASEIADAAGGLDVAAGLWSDFFATFYTDIERAAFQLEQAAAAAAEQFAGIGLSLDGFTGSDGLARFRALFESVLPDLTAEQVVAWLQAARALGILTDATAQFAQFAQQVAQTLPGQFAPGGGGKPDPGGFEQVPPFEPGGGTPAPPWWFDPFDPRNYVPDMSDPIGGPGSGLPDAIDRSVAALERWIETLDRLQRDLLTDETLSILTPAERLAEIERQYADAFAGALAGDQASRDIFDQLARQFAEVGRDFFGSSDGYTDIFTRILADIGLLRSTAGAPISSSPVINNPPGSGSGAGASPAADPFKEALINRLELIETRLATIQTASVQTAAATTETANNTAMQQERTYG